MSMQRPNLCKMRRLWIINEALLIAVLVVGLSTAADQLLWGVPTRCGGSSIDDQGQKLSYALTCLENRRAEEVPYFYQPDPSFYPNDWVNCSKYIDKDMRIPSPNFVYDNSNIFSPSIYPANWAASRLSNSFQHDAWVSYYNSNKHIGKKCIDAMKKHWCLNLLGVADPEDPNKYAVYSCKSLCDYVFDQCDAHNNDYTNSKFDGCGTAKYGPDRRQTQFFKDIPIRACFTENSTIKMPDCSETLGFECLNGGTWHAECLGCICQPGFGGYNCGRCSTTGRSFPGTTNTKYPTQFSRSQWANNACSKLGKSFNGTNNVCHEYNTFGTEVLPNDLNLVPTFECVSKIFLQFKWRKFVEAD